MLLLFKIVDLSDFETTLGEAGGEKNKAYPNSIGRSILPHLPNLPHLPHLPQPEN